MDSNIYWGSIPQLNKFIHTDYTWYDEQDKFTILSEADRIKYQQAAYLFVSRGEDHTHTHTHQAASTLSLAA